MLLKNLLKKFAQDIILRILEGESSFLYAHIRPIETLMSLKDDCSWQYPSLLGTSGTAGHFLAHVSKFRNKIQPQRDSNDARRGIECPYFALNQDFTTSLEVNRPVLLSSPILALVLLDIWIGRGFRASGLSTLIHRLRNFFLLSVRGIIC